MDPNWGLRLDETIVQLRGLRGIKIYREMSENDPIISAILIAMDQMIRSVPWRFVGEDEWHIKFVEECLHEMEDKTFEEFISEVLSFLPYGFSLFETVAKRRKDGYIVLKKLAPRAQWTIDRFKVANNEITGVYQTSGQGQAFIPAWKMLHFRTRSVNDQPSGVSVLRGAYTSWYAADNIKRIEAISIERELNGLPMWSLPGAWLSEDAEEWQKRFVASAKQIARDVKRNNQGYIIKPSDLWQNDDERGMTSQLTSQQMVRFELVASQGTRDIDTGKVIMRYQQDMARSAMADFIMLGSNDRGSFALSKSKSDLFLKALEGYLGGISSIINKRLIPRIWAWNGFPPEKMPKIKHGSVAPINLDELGKYIRLLSASKLDLFPNEELTEHLHDIAGLPKPNPDLASRPASNDGADDDMTGTGVRGQPDRTPTERSGRINTDS